MNEEIQQWRADGVICLRGVFSSDWQDLLEDGFDQSVNSPSSLSKDYAEVGKGSFFTDHAMHRRVELHAGLLLLQKRHTPAP